MAALDETSRKIPVIEIQKGLHYAERQGYPGARRTGLPKHARWAVVTCVLLSVALACSSGAKDTMPTATTPPFPKGLKPPDADAPTAGICAQPPSGDVVTITINVDVPSPRCSQIKATQRLHVTNNTEGALEIDLGASHASLGPGEGQTLDGGPPVGTYQAPGVHFMRTTSLAGGVEIWLIDGNSSPDEAATDGAGTGTDSASSRGAGPDTHSGSAPLGPSGAPPYVRDTAGGPSIPYR